MLGLVDEQFILKLDFINFLKNTRVRKTQTHLHITLEIILK